MRFVTYSIHDKIQVGAIAHDNEYICDINRELGTDFADMNQLISEMSDSELELLHAKLNDNNINVKIPMQEVKILAPIPYPKRALFCLGKNYSDHAKEVAGLPGAEDEMPRFPIFFMKIADPAIGHLDTIPNHQEITKMIDYEVELAVIIGKDGIDISKEDAYDYIFGYTIANDISARNIQRKHSQWVKGKSLEGFAPLGPCIVHRSSFATPIELDIKCWVNGELRQDSNTRQLIFDIPTIISELSKGMYLRKNDIILTGTPAGVGLGFSPYKFLNPGDVVTCEIEGIGVLENSIAR